MKLDGPFFHMAFLVPDLDEALDRYESLLGVEFREPWTLHLRGVEGVRLTYSVEGPPYVELVEGTDGDGVFARSQGEGLHHVGMWAPGDEPAHHAELRLDGGDGEPFAWFTHRAPGAGMRIEYVDERRRPGMERWWAKGVSRRAAQPPADDAPS